MLSSRKRAALWLCLSLASGATFVLVSPRAQAQPVFRSDLLGSWKSGLNDRYVFRSNGTYTFSLGDFATNNLAHSGTWQLLDGGTRLRLHATSRVVRQNGRRRVVRANKVFFLSVETKDPETVTFDGAYFHRPRTGRARED